MIHPYYKAPIFFRLLRSGEIKTIIQYLVSGALTSGSDYTVFFICLNMLNAGLLIATVAAYIVGLVVSFLLNRYWVFDQNASGSQFATNVWRYSTLLIVNLLITYAMLWALEQWFGISPLIGKFIVWFFMIFWIYAADKFWVFRGPRKVRDTLFR